MRWNNMKYDELGWSEILSTQTRTNEPRNINYFKHIRYDALGWDKILHKMAYYKIKVCKMI